MLAKQYKAKGGGYRWWLEQRVREAYEHGQDRSGEL